jgi:dienelactone hydrolase
VDVVAAARQLKVPTLFVAAKDDLGYAEESRGLAAATPKLLSTLTLVPGMQHGDVMLLDPTGAPMPAAVAVEHLLTVGFAH